METRLDLRRLTAADIGALRALNDVFADAFEDDDHYRGAPPDDAWISGVLGKPGVIALVALVDGQVVGGLVGYELDKLERARREIYLYDLAVAATHRRRGIATALIRRLREIASSRGAEVVYVQADRGDEAAIALYSKEGVREDVLHFDFPVRS